jgi:hypothetical protein
MIVAKSSNESLHRLRLCLYRFNAISTWSDAELEDSLGLCMYADSVVPVV